MIYIIRHGKTELNKAKVLQGRSDFPLNEEGIRQAEEAAARLGDVTFAHVYSSPLTISVEMDGHYYRTSTNGADEILFSKDEGIVLDGQGAYSFEAALDADIKDYSLVEISSSASGKVKIINPDDSITLDSELPCQDIAVNYMNIDGGTRDVIEEEQDHLNIFEENNKIKYGDGINIASATVTGIESAYQYSGKEIKPEIMVMLEGKVLIKDTDYSVEYLNNVTPVSA